MICLDCNGELVEGIVDYSFPYGLQSPVTLTVSHPGFHCPACNLIVTDERGEDARRAAIRNHLEKEKV